MSYKVLDILQWEIYYNISKKLTITNNNFSKLNTLIEADSHLNLV